MWKNGQWKGSIYDVIGTISFESHPDGQSRASWSKRLEIPEDSISGEIAAFLDGGELAEEIQCKGCDRRLADANRVT